MNNFNTPRLIELVSKRNAEQVEKTTMIAEIANMRARMATESSGAGNAAENRVRAILGEAVQPDTTPDISKLEAMLQELNIRNRTIAILDDLITTEKAAASRLLCKAEKPEVDKRGKAFARAFVELHAAQLEYHDYLDRIQDTGASIGSLPNVFISGLGNAKDRSGQYWYGMKDFIGAGYLSPSDKPKELQ
jgi:hypothetical protein